MMKREMQLEQQKRARSPSPTPEIRSSGRTTRGVNNSAAYIGLLSKKAQEAHKERETFADETSSTEVEASYEVPFFISNLKVTC